MTSIRYEKSEILKNEFPEFSKLDVYGTVEEPLFPGSQVAELLGNVRIHYQQDFELGTDYLKAVCTTKDGAMREQNMFTEQGIYNAVFRSRTVVGKRFRKFITLVLKQIRLSGQFPILEFIQTYQLDTVEELSHLYIIDLGFNGWYKIGRSCKVCQRIKTLQTANPYKLELVKTFDNKGPLEFQIHDKARSVTSNYRGECFQLNAVELETIMSYADQLV